MKMELGSRLGRHCGLEKGITVAKTAGHVGCICRGCSELRKCSRHMSIFAISGSLGFPFARKQIHGHPPPPRPHELPSLYSLFKMANNRFYMCFAFALRLKSGPNSKSEYKQKHIGGFSKVCLVEVKQHLFSVICLAL